MSGSPVLLTESVPGTGGAMVELDDFVVEEIPAYSPAGSGEHCFLLVEKQDLTTPRAIELLCRELSADPSSAGYAGLKDRRAVTRQWISLHGVRPERARGVELPGLRVLEAAAHPHKLRTGHLRGNRFRARLRGVVAGARERAEAVLLELEREGLPNAFGAQRFGRAADNAAQGLRLLRGELRGASRFQRRLYTSALQSALFNEVLARRMARGALRRLLGGEVLERQGTARLRVSAPSELERDQALVSGGEESVTGPICGPRMLRCAPGSAAAELEQDVFEAQGVSPEQFARLGRIARGGRRPLTVPVLGATVHSLGPDVLELGFILPAGAYATVLLREVTKAGTAATAERSGELEDAAAGSAGELEETDDGPADGTKDDL